jgi:hypothetical protein
MLDQRRDRATRIGTYSLMKDAWSGHSVVVTGADPVFEPRIRWAPKLRTDKLVRLYQTDAAGRRDDELLADVGWSLYSRLCDVQRVVRGEVACPRCQTDFVVRNSNQDLDTMVSCPSCGWQTTPRQWHKSWEHRGLNGHCPEFEVFVTRWPDVKEPNQQMMLIDRVVHALHVAAHGSIGNFAARNFLEGKRPRIAAILDQLAYGPASTIETETREQWAVANEIYWSTRRRPSSAP